MVAYRFRRRPGLRRCAQVWLSPAWIRAWPVAAGGSSSPAFTLALCRRPTTSQGAGRWTRREGVVAPARSAHPNQKKKIPPPTRPEPLSAHSVCNCVKKVHVPFLVPPKNRGCLHSSTCAHKKLSPKRVGVHLCRLVAVEQLSSKFHRVEATPNSQLPVAKPLRKPESLRKA